MWFSRCRSMQGPQSNYRIALVAILRREASLTQTTVSLGGEGGVEGATALLGVCGPFRMSDFKDSSHRYPLAAAGASNPSSASKIKCAGLAGGAFILRFTDLHCQHPGCHYLVKVVDPRSSRPEWSESQLRRPEGFDERKAG